MKQRLSALFLSLTMILTPAALAAESNLFPADISMPVFTDISADGKSGGGWYDYSGIQVCVETGLMKGVGNGSVFSPGGNISVAEVAMVCARINEKMTGYAIPVLEKGQPWYAPAISVMEHVGAVTPADPTVSATRADFVRLLSAVVPSKMLSPINSITVLPDTGDADVLRFYNAGIVTGADKYGTFAGDRGLTRAEAAAMLARIVRPGLRKTFTLEVKPADPVMDILGVSGDTAVFTVNGNAITAQEYLYWLIYTTENLGYYNFGSADEIDWAAQQDGQTFSDFIKEDARNTAVLYSIVEAEAAKAGVILTQEDLAAIDKLIADDRADYGEASFQARLKEMGLTEEAFRSLLKTSSLYQNLKNHLFGVMSQKDVDSFVKDEGLLSAKHILVSDKALGENILAQIRAAADPAAKFDELMNQYSEDGRGRDGKLTSPEGYVFGPDEMVQEFEDGTRALKAGEISGLIQTYYGYHIILRLDVRAEDTLSIAGESVRDRWTNVQMNAFMNTKIAAAAIVDTDLYGNINPRTVWETVAAY